MRLRSFRNTAHSCFRFLLIRGTLPPPSFFHPSRTAWVCNCRFSRLPFLPPFKRRCFAHIIAKSYHRRTIIQFSKYPKGKEPFTNSQSHPRFGRVVLKKYFPSHLFELGERKWTPQIRKFSIFEKKKSVRCYWNASKFAACRGDFRRFFAL